MRRDVCPLCGEVSREMVGWVEDLKVGELGESYICGNPDHGVIWWPTENEINWKGVCDVPSSSLT